MQRRSGLTQKAGSPRQGAMMILVGLLLTVIFFFAALVVDHGYTSVTKSRLQATADAASLAGIDILSSDGRLGGTAVAEQLAAEAVSAARQVAALNWPTELPLNSETDVTITLGMVNADGDFVETPPAVATAISVEVLAPEVSMVFAPVLGITKRNVGALAVASYATEVQEIRIREPGTRAPIFPLTVSRTQWELTLLGIGPDSYRWSDEYQSFSTAPDGLVEHDLFNGDKNSSGNFGTINIGRSNNGMPGLVDQISNGATEQQLDAFGGSLALDPVSGTLEIPGDPGLGGPVFTAVQGIIGETRLIPIFDSVTGNGSNTVYTITGFAGVRIVDANGKGKNKYIRIQPASVSHSSIVMGSSGFETWNVTSDSRLTR